MGKYPALIAEQTFLLEPSLALTTFEPREIVPSHHFEVVAQLSFRTNQAFSDPSNDSPSRNLVFFRTKPPSGSSAQLARLFQANPLGLEALPLSNLDNPTHPFTLSLYGPIGIYLSDTGPSQSDSRVRKNSNRWANSSTRTPPLRQTAEPDVETTTRVPSVRVDGPNGNRSGLIIMRPVLIKTEIPSTFKQSDMSYLKERFNMPSQVELFALGPLERADSPREGWIYLYKIAFKIRLRLPFHYIINMAPHDAWKALLIIREVYSTGYTSEFGIRFVWTKRASNLSERLWITAEQKNVIRALLKTKTKSFFLYFLKIPSARHGCIRLLYGVPTDHLWASYPTINMGKLKMKISKAKLEAIKRKKKDKQSALKGGASSQADKGEERPNTMVSVQQSSLPIVIPCGDSSPSKRQRCSSPNSR
ncbi:hypothetical protein FNV43_RR15458 [Rhamnella rubrinervis]|uniref:Uncharacterized protein n=1 Tax=Rhamnella rubrinervis TaxID=2594499 RepID=A0A8K0E8Y2_9ROSA|nr:hypothetical protein FNV43_RR15458 [Rhamnella rubrinervis]